MPSAAETTWSASASDGSKVSGDAGDLCVGKAGQPQPLHPDAALELGQPLPGIAAQILVAYGRDDEHPLIAQPDRV